MRKTELKITHPEVTYEALNEYVSGRGLVRAGLRIAVLQGIIDNVPIEHLGLRHNMSRQGIYDLVKRINKKGIAGVEDIKRPGRPSGLTEEIANDLRKQLIESPRNQGYRQSRWDGPLIRTYLKEKHAVNIGHSQVNVWLHLINFSVQRGRKKYNKGDPEKQAAFADNIKKTPKSKT